MEERFLHTEEVTGSNPVSPTIETGISAIRTVLRIFFFWASGPRGFSIAYYYIKIDMTDRAKVLICPSIIRAPHARSANDRIQISRCYAGSGLSRTAPTPTTSSTGTEKIVPISGDFSARVLLTADMIFNFSSR